MNVARSTTALSFVPSKSSRVTTTRLPIVSSVLDIWVTLRLLSTADKIERAERTRR